MMFQILQGPLGLLRPLELILAFQEVEEGQSSLPESGDEPVQGRHTTC
jgi:hypothetical protein